jgi:toxoflavin biosynthesis protein ToxD
MMMGRNQPRVSSRIWWLAVVAISIVSILNFNVQLTPAQSLRRDRCEVGQEFVFSPAGKFIAGSDRTERDYGYHLLALALVDDPKQVSQIEQQLKKQSWFEAENPRQSFPTQPQPLWGRRHVGKCV